MDMVEGAPSVETPSRDLFVDGPLLVDFFNHSVIADVSNKASTHHHEKGDSEDNDTEAHILSAKLS